ncbi:hypothetical protein Gpo141_00008596 [Globisporangium polare]
MDEPAEHSGGATSPPATTPAAADPTLPEERAIHAGVFVLGSRVLWDLITGFVAGYPLVVHTFQERQRQACRQA